MIFRLEYKNRDGVQARLDITTPGSSIVKEIEGTEQPFLLSYKGDKNDKSLNFLTSSAEINIYETPEFNIDKLKTSNETQIKVDFYIDTVKYWTGFVIPDFFQREIGGAGVVSMVASDRISTLKGVTLSDLPSMISIRELAVQCLAKTGLDLPLKTMADFQHGSTVNGFFTSEVSSQRLYDTRGRSISCYDILKSILVASNSRLEQAGGEWRITNKLQHELGTGRVYSDTNTFTNYSENVFNFDEVTRGAMRTIVPVAGSVGIYHEHGGGKMHPENFDFSQGMVGWTAVSGFDCSIEDREVKGFTSGYPMWGVEYGEKERKRLMIRQSYHNVWAIPDTLPYVRTSFPVITTNENSVNIEIDISVLGSGSNVAGSIGRFLVLAEKGSERLAFNPASGGFEVYDQDKWRGSESAYFIRLTPNWEKEGEVATRSAKFTASLEVDGDLSDYNVTIRAYGVSTITGAYSPIFVDKASIRFSNTQDVPKGVIYKTDQGGEFTKTHDIETTIFGDYLTKGLDGYFYDYPIDDTSSLYQDGELTSLWATPFVAGESGVYNLLRHSVIQHRRMFSVAHDLISGEIDLSTFNPLTIFKDCNDKRYVVVSAEFDFLRSNVKVELEEIAYANLTVRDFIYSYFGEGESGISSVGGISAGSGSGGSGSGMTADQVAILSEVQELAHEHENKNILDQVTQEVVDSGKRKMIRENDEDQLTDDNYLSSLRVLKEILDNNEDLKEVFLSKIDPDTAKGLIKFLAGINIGEFIPGMFGGKGARIDALGNIEATSLVLRALLEVPELRYNRLTVIGDELILTENGLIHTAEEIGDRSYQLNMKLEEGEAISFVSGDLIKGIFHHSNGFATSYMIVSEVGQTFMKATLANDADVPTPYNIPPQNFMNIARVGNVSDTDRQRYMVFSSKLGGYQLYDGCTDFLNGRLVASFDTAQSFKHLFDNLPLREGLPYIYAAGLVVQDIIRVDYQGKAVREVYDRGPWEAERTYYNNDEQGTDDVWHYGCRWRCFSSSTTEEPRWDSAAWVMIEGNPYFELDFAENEVLFDPDRFNTTLTIVASLYNRDITADILNQDVEWSRYSEDANGIERVASDHAWNIRRHNSGKVLNLTGEDADFNGYIPLKLRFTATVTLRDGMSKQISFEYI